MFNLRTEKYETCDLSSFVLAGAAWFGGDSFSHLLSEYQQYFTIPKKVFNEIIHTSHVAEVFKIQNNNTIKIRHSKGRKIDLAIMYLLSKWCLLYSDSQQKGYFLPQMEFLKLMIYKYSTVFSKEIIRKMLGENEFTVKGELLDKNNAHMKDKEDKRNRGKSTQFRPKNYVSIYWSFIFRSFLKIKLLNLNDKYNELRLFCFRYSISPQIQDIIKEETDTPSYKQLFQVLNKLQIISKVTAFNNEIILLNKSILEDN